MASFIDSTGRRWTVEITIGKLRKLKAAGLVLDQTNAFGVDDLLDPLFVADVLTVLMPSEKPEAIEDMLVGQVIDHARSAIVEAMLFFFPPATVAIIEAGLEMQKRALERAVKACGVPSPS
jgi:hypothetical protein